MTQRSIEQLLADAERLGDSRTYRLPTGTPKRDPNYGKRKPAVKQRPSHWQNFTSNKLAYLLLFAIVFVGTLLFLFEYTGY